MKLLNAERYQLSNLNPSSWHPNCFVCSLNCKSRVETQRFV
ncbi:MAG TPA: hypothetical protein ENJ55_01340 [Rhizobiales bacterium]|nr:hypothetical protein [Hyphomicrobiales bacterium]